MRSQLKTTLNGIICLLLLHISNAKEYAGEPVSVGSITSPLRIGESAELKCTIRLKLLPTVMSWTKVPTGATIAYQNRSLDQSKYSLVVKYQPNLIEYRLFILNFNMTDLNCIYKCDADFFSSSVMLDSKRYDFVVIPSKNDIEKNIIVMKGKLTASILLKRMYPKLLCTAYIDDEHNVTYALPTTNTAVSNGMFFQTRLEVFANIKICEGYLNVNCSFGHHSYPILSEKYVNGCKVEDTISDVLEKRWSLVAITVLLLLLVVGALIGVVYIKKTRCRMIHQTCCSKELENWNTQPTPLHTVRDSDYNVVNKEVALARDTDNPTVINYSDSSSLTMGDESKQFGPNSSPDVEVTFVSEVSRIPSSGGTKPHIHSAGSYVSLSKYRDRTYSVN